MSQTVRVPNITAGHTLELVQQLCEQGYKKHQDFDFAYHQSRWDEMTGEIPRETIFTFYNPVLASWFAVKYL